MPVLFLVGWDFLRHSVKLHNKKWNKRKKLTSLYIRGKIFSIKQCDICIQKANLFVEYGYIDEK